MTNTYQRTGTANERIAAAFDGKKAFIPFITAGYPTVETTAAVVRAAVKAGSDLVELGVPFSDPTAEGPVIQGANEVALENGATTEKIFELVEDLRRDVTVPLVFMTYANVVFSPGAEKFISRCAEVGIDGLILPDIPLEERGEFQEVCDKYDVALIPLVAPTSHDRVAAIAQAAQGFVYIVSSLGVTGIRKEITTDIPSIVKIIRENTDIPCAVGFGISRPDQAAEMSAASDGAIVGSAIIKVITEASEKGGSTEEIAGAVYEYVAEMKAAM